MKHMKLTLVGLSLILATPLIEAQARPHRRNPGHSYRLDYRADYPYYYSGNYYRSPWWDASYGRRGYYYPRNDSASVDLTCSPSTLAKNTDGVEAVLSGLVESDFSESEIFKQKVGDLSQLTGSKKIEEAFRLIGIRNPKDTKEVMNALFARSISSETVARVSENLKLSVEQARLLITVVTQAIRP